MFNNVNVSERMTSSLISVFVPYDIRDQYAILAPDRLPQIDYITISVADIEEDIIACYIEFKDGTFHDWDIQMPVVPVEGGVNFWKGWCLREEGTVEDSHTESNGDNNGH